MNSFIYYEINRLMSLGWLTALCACKYINDLHIILIFSVLNALKIEENANNGSAYL